MKYEVVLRRVAWFAVEADSPEEAVRKAKAHASVEHYEDSDDDLMYVPEEMYEDDLQYYEDRNIVD